MAGLGAIAGCCLPALVLVDAFNTIVLARWTRHIAMLSWRMTRRAWLALAAAAPLPAANTPDIDRFFDDFLTRWVRADPEMATTLRFFTGAEQDRLDGQLSDIT